MKKLEKHKLPRIDLACSDDNFRLVMNYILVTKDEIVASNSHILVIHKTNNIFDEQFIDEMPDRFLIHKNNWKLFCKGHHYIIFLDGLIIIRYDGYDQTIKPIFEEIEFMTLKYPDYKKILKSKSETGLSNFGLSVKNLTLLSKSMGCDRLKFEFTQGEYSHLNVSNGEIKGIIMPIMID